MFHADELAAQALAGLSANRAAIRPFMPDQHREFLAMLPYLFSATADGRGWPVASVLTGAPGFARSPDPKTLSLPRPRSTAWYSTLRSACSASISPTGGAIVPTAGWWP